MGSKSRSEVLALQKALNTFTDKYLLDVPPIKVDGDKGHATNKRVRQCKFWLGYTKKNRNALVGKAFMWRLRHPLARGLTQTPAALKRGHERRVEQRKDAKANRASAGRTTGVGTFDGIPCANVAIRYLKWAREHGWQGHLTSGWRDPVYSRSLCRNMCGADSCPGKCAGLTSNHVGSTPERFAMDVTDYVRFGELMAKCPLEPKLHNYLGAADPVHWSPNGR